MLYNLKKLQKRSWRERSLLLEAIWRLGFARVSVLLRPFRSIAPTLGEQGNTILEFLNPQQYTQAEKIGWAVRTAARRTPWRSNCLTQAIAAKRMLQSRGIPSTLFLGVRKTNDDTENLNAHAWIKCGDIVLTGKQRHLTYTVVSRFSDQSPEK